MTIYIAGLFTHDLQTKTVLFALASPIQIFFFYLEMIEMYYIGIRKYLFGYDWNMKDLLFFISFVLHVVLYYVGEINSVEHRYMPYNLVSIFCLWISMEKLFQYISIFDSFSFIVKMMSQVYIDLIPFLIIFFLFIAFFTFIIVIMVARVADVDGAGNDYSGIGQFLKIFISNFRLSVGDLIVPDIGFWTTNLVTCLESDDPDFDDTKLCA